MSYQVLTYKQEGGDRLYDLENDGLYHDRQDRENAWAQNVFDDRNPIIKVKRLNDNSIYQIGDRYLDLVITEFRKVGEEIICIIPTQDFPNNSIRLVNLQHHTNMSFQIKTVIRERDNRRISVNGQFRLTADGEAFAITRLVPRNNTIEVHGETTNGRTTTINLGELVMVEEWANRRQTEERTTQTAATEIIRIQNIINQTNPRTIRIAGLLKRRTENLTQFIIKFLKEWNLQKDTIYTDDRTVQTTAGRRRSLGDIYMVCKYYYPNVTLAEVARIIYNNNFINNNGLRTSYCSTINKRVWYYNQGSPALIHEPTRNDEFAKTWAFYQTV